MMTEYESIRFEYTLATCSDTVCSTGILIHQKAPGNTLMWNMYLKRMNTRNGTNIIHIIMYIKNVILSSNSNMIAHIHANIINIIQNMISSFV